MPKVEQYGANRQNLSFTPGAQAPMRSLDKFPGAQLAQGLSDVSKTLNHLQDDLSTTEAEDAIVQYKRSVQDFSTNPDTGYLNTQGKDAVHGAKAASDALDEMQKAHAANLSGAASEKFLRVANNITTSTRGKYMAHAAQGQHDYKIATNKALQVSALETGAAETDPVKRNEQLQLGLSHVKDGNKFNKITGVLAQKNLDEYKSAFHQSVLHEMASQPGRAAEALDYFKAHKSELTPDAKIKMRELTKTAGLLDFTQSRTDEIITKYADARSGLAAARKENDPEKRKALVASVKARYAENEALKKLDVSNRTNDLLNRIEQDGYTATATDLHDLPAANRNAIAGAEKRSQTGEPVTNDEEAYFNLIDSLRSMNQKQANEALQNLHVNYSDKLDRPHLEAAHRMLSANVARFDKPTPVQKSLWAAGSEITHRIAILPNKVGKTKASVMYTKAMEAVQIATDAKGKPLTGAEQTDIINRALNDVVLKPGFFPPKYTGYDKVNAAALEDTSGILVETNAAGELPHFSTFVFDKADQKELERLRRVFIGDQKHEPSHQELADWYVHVHEAQK